MPRVSKRDQLFVAKESGTTVIKDQEYAYVAGTTRVRGDHPLLKAVPENFEPAEDHVSHEPGSEVIASAPRDVTETATAGPGEKRNR